MTDMRIHELLKTSEWDAPLDREEIKEYFQTHDVNETFYVSGGASQTLLTPLAYVASKSINNFDRDNALDVMRDLIELGADVNAPVRKSDYYGDGFLKGDGKELVDLANGTDRIELLVKSGASAKESHILSLFQEGADGAFIAEKYFDLIEPRHFFHLKNNDASAAIIDELALAGYDFNVQDENGDTPLSYVRDIHNVKRLVDSGASVRIPNNDGETFLDQCRAEFIAKNSSANGAQIMRDLGVNLSAPDYFGDTALHKMMYEGNNLERIRNLLDAGADPTVRDADDKLPYQVDSRGEDRHEAKLLLESAATKRKLVEELGESQQQLDMRRKM
ncbi:hypothetical protein I5U33_00570 [Stenotrophomonas maltophilia]|nr:hypothetical protein [Stenotrophomonas maltophilia]